PPLPETGPSEVRDAAAAFNVMQSRIRSYVEERTEMLAAIAHDLQTPLTRLRLRLEKVADENLRDKLVADLGAMQEMIREGLDLATSLDTGGMMQRVDLDSLLSSVCADAVSRDGRSRAGADDRAQQCTQTWRYAGCAQRGEWWFGMHVDAAAQ